MKVKEIKEITALATTERFVLNQYREFTLGNINWDKMSLNMIRLISVYSQNDVVSFMDFLENNENNSLPERSSGSFYTALTDIDSFFSLLNNFNYTDEFLEENADEIARIYNTIMFGK